MAEPIKRAGYTRNGYAANARASDGGVQEELGARIALKQSRCLGQKSASGLFDHLVGARQQPPFA
jgi:hypothetical protein